MCVRGGVSSPLLEEWNITRKQVSKGTGHETDEVEINVERVGMLRHLLAGARWQFLSVSGGTREETAMQLSADDTCAPL